MSKKNKNAIGVVYSISFLSPSEELYRLGACGCTATTDFSLHSTMAMTAELKDFTKTVVVLEKTSNYAT